MSASRTSDAPSSSGALLLVLIALVCAALAHWVRLESAVGVGFEQPGAWGSYDADTLYHARRVERGVRTGGWVASRDPLLAHGEDDPSRSLRGVPIPWPPFYDLLLTAAYRRALPSVDALMQPEEHPEAPPLGTAERGRIERFVASAPLWFGTLTAFLAALFAGGLARETLRGRAFQRTGALSAAAFAGAYVALSYAHIRYSRLGNGDHHAFVSFLHLAMLGVFARALRHGSLSQPVWSAVRGSAAGLLAGLMIATWTASIFWVALLQAVLVFRLLVPFRDPSGRRFSARGLPIFSTSFHKAALLVVVPAVIESPFTESDPWSLVNLSWFHLAWLSVGWLVFAPYALMPKTSSQHRAVSLLPAVLVGGLVLAVTPALRSFGEATSWATAGNVFMGSINESKPLLFGPGGSTASMLKFCGTLVVVLPVAILLFCRGVTQHPERLPYLVTAAAAMLAAALQRRFAESLAGPAAVVLALGLAVFLTNALRRRGVVRTGTIGLALCIAASVTLAAVNFHPSIRNARQFGALQDAGGRRFPNATSISSSEAELASFLGSLGEELRGPERDAPGVLAHWDLGHALEWRAGLATVATNFGLYVGEDAFLDPWRFLLSTDEGAAKDILDRRDVTYVFFDGDRNRAAMGEALEQPVLDPQFWGRTMAGRLMGAPGAAAVPGFLALRAEGRRSGGAPMQLYEVVEGITLEAESANKLEVIVTLEASDGTRSTWRTVDGASVGTTATLRVEVPYGIPPAEVGAESESLPSGTQGPWLRVRSLRVLVDGLERELPGAQKSVVNGSVLRL